jgi:hypothetical protein
MLRSLSQIFDKAAQQAGDKKIDLAALPTARLAPDMFPLTSRCRSPAIMPRMPPRA